jgi:hypothetical protein
MVHNDPTPGPGPESLLESRYGTRWLIQLEDLGVWSAVRKSEDGRHVRVLVARTAAELLAKLETAEAGQPVVPPPCPRCRSVTPHVTYAGITGPDDDTRNCWSCGACGHEWTTP